MPFGRVSLLKNPASLYILGSIDLADAGRPCFQEDGVTKGVLMKRIAVFACFLLLLALALPLIGCGGSEEAKSGTPEAVAQAFWAAAMKHDVEATWDMFSSSLQSSLQSKAKWDETLKTNDPKATVKAGKATVTGETAEVPVTISYGTGEKSTQNVRLVKEGGVWKVDMP
jgi:hypothetical protein